MRNQLSAASPGSAQPPRGLRSLGDVSTFLHWVKFRRKGQSAESVFLRGSEPVSFPVAGPGACLCSTWNSFPLKERPAGTVEKSKGNSMAGLTICYEVQKRIKQSRGWGSQTGTHSSRHSLEASRFS